MGALPPPLGGGGVGWGHSLPLNPPRKRGGGKPRRGRGGVGEVIALPHDFTQNRLRLVVYLLICEANDSVAALLQVSCAGLVVFDLGCVTIAVNLDHELVRDTAKVRDAVPDGMLAAELDSTQLFASQIGPEIALGGRNRRRSLGSLGRSEGRY